MAIQRNRYGFDGEVSFECDECGEELHTDQADFKDALIIMKSEGWRSVKGRHDWHHVCGSCGDLEDDPEEDFEKLI